MDLNSAFGNGNNTGKPPGGLAAFGTAEPAPEYAPLPAGVYLTRVERGEYYTTKTKGEDAYRMIFQVTEGSQSGRTIPRYWTFTPKSIGYAQRDLPPFGLNTPAKLLEAFPAGREYICRLTVTLQRGDDGAERNDIKRIEILRVVESPVAAFMLPEEGEGGPK